MGLICRHGGKWRWRHRLRSPVSAPRERCRAWSRNLPQGGRTRLRSQPVVVCTSAHIDVPARQANDPARLRFDDHLERTRIGGVREASYASGTWAGLKRCVTSCPGSTLPDRRRSSSIGVLLTVSSRRVVIVMLRIPQVLETQAATALINRSQPIRECGRTSPWPRSSSRTNWPRVRCGRVS